MVYCATHAGAVELRKELSTLTALKLPATLIFDYPSVAEMTAAMAAMLPAVSATTEAARAQAAQVLKGDLKRAAATSNEGSASHWLPQVGSHVLTQIPAKACLHTRGEIYWGPAGTQPAIHQSRKCACIIWPACTTASALTSAGAWRHQGDHGR